MFDFIFSVDFLWWLVLILYVPACFALIIIVLLQKGKGVGFAGAFGMGGGSDTVFGPRSVKSLPQKLTYTAAGVFMTLAFVLSLLSPHVGRGVAPETEDEQSYMSGTAMDELLGQQPATPAPEAAPATETTPSVVVNPAPAPAEAPPAEAPPEQATPAEEAAPAQAAPTQDTEETSPPATSSEAPAAQ